MFIPTTLDAIQAAYPTQFSRAVATFRKSRSKFKAEPIEVFDEWGYELSVQVSAFSLADVLSGEAARVRAAYEALTIDEKVQDYAARCCVVFQGRIKKRPILTSESLLPIPAVVLDEHRRWLVEAFIPERR